jgi:chromosome segregation ATPase
MGYLAGGEQPSTFRLEEFRRTLARRWPEALVEDYDVALERMREARRAARRRGATNVEKRQTEGRESLRTLRDSIASSRTTEEQLRRRLANLESPYKEKWDQLILTLKQKLQRLTAAQAQARRLAARLRTLSRVKQTKGVRSRRAQVRKQLKKSLDQVRQLQRQMNAGKAQRKALESQHAAQIHPVKHELNRVRLDRQANEKESERIEELLELPAGTPPSADSFRRWRTVTEVDLLRDLRAHWND